MKTSVISIKDIQPFETLPEFEIKDILSNGKEEYIKKETLLYHQNYTKLSYIDLILEGSYQTYFVGDSLKKEQVEMMGPMEVYGGVSLLYNDRLSIRSVVALPDTKILRVPQSIFLALVDRYPDFKAYFSNQFGDKMMGKDYSHQMKKNSARSSSSSLYDHFFTKSIASLRPKPMITCHPWDSVQRAAQIMSEHKQSCIFVRDDQTGEYLGYLTDITIRETIVSNGVDLRSHARDFMQVPIFVINKEALVYEAILMMFKHKIRYIVVEDKGEYTGILSRNKLLSDQSYSPFMFIQSFKLATSLDELKERWERTPEIVFQLLSRGVTAENVNQVISTISDSITNIIIEKTIEELGPPPCKFVFMVLGSEGRKEQTLKTDQDNAIIYEDRPASERENIRSYFLRFSEKVSQHLNTVGFVYCTGGYMAKNPKWNHSLSHWKNNYSEWIDEIIPQTAANFATFFDTRRVYGDRELIDELKDHIKLQLEKSSSKLFYYLAVEALKYEPPLTFFKNIKTVSRDNQAVFDMKHAMTPIVDLVRVYSLKHRIMATNTGERLKQLYQNDLVQREEYYELLQSYYYLMSMRLKRQAKTIIRKQGPPSNFIEPKSLTNIERVTLREIFKVIERFQTKMKMEFTGAGLF